MRNDPPAATLRLAAQLSIRTHYREAAQQPDFSRNGRNFEAANAGRVNVWMPSGASARVLAALSLDVPYSATQLGERLHIGRKHIMQVLRDLCASGFAERLGEEGSYRYRLRGAR